MKLYPHELFPKNSSIKKLEDCKKTLRVVFVRKLERAIENHVKMLMNNAGINSILQKPKSDFLEESAEDDSGHKSKQNDEENDVSDDEDEADDLGSDALKRRRQQTDEIEYEDCAENQKGELSRFDCENDPVKDNENNTTFEDEMVDASGFGSENDPVEGNENGNTGEDEMEPESESKEEEKRNDYDRRISVSFTGLEFKIKFQLIEEPHILLSQLAQRAAKNVYIRKSGRIDRCSLINDTKRDEPPTIRTSGVAFQALWDMQDDLVINSVKSNDIQAMFRAYGVEAARRTIVNELRNVFSLYGVSTDFRHLGLIADFMTHSGKYWPFSRYGYGMADSTLPFKKMSFETASTFLKSAAYHGEVDSLESPSARICLDLPVKMGTGCFDLMQKV